MKKHAAPILAAVLLLLPVLYVGSYFALVEPFARRIHSQKNYVEPTDEHYRVPGNFCAKFFWPLETVDRELRPDTWLLPLKYAM